MALRIETFSNKSGGSTFFKAIGHPLAADRLRPLIAGLAGKRFALYDPLGLAEQLNALYPLPVAGLAGCFVQDVQAVGKTLLGRRCEPVTQLGECGAEAVLVVAFDAERPIGQLGHLLPKAAQVLSLDAARLPAAMLSARPYLNGLNFATNFVFFRDGGGHHTRLTTANYWSGYASCQPVAWCRLFDGAGAVLAEWSEPLPAADSGLAIDSAEVRQRFGLPEFTGQLFVHVTAIAGHDVVKYALDTYNGSGSALSATHDANSWPADHYAGLPAPAPGERVTLWVQNSHPAVIPAGEVGLSRMGREEVRRIAESIPPFGTLALDTRTLFPETVWPAQFEIEAGRWIVRPRYEVENAAGRRRIAHVNVEREDLLPDPAIAEQGNLLGKGYILPAAVLPAERYATTLLPTPMARSQWALPLQVAVYDPQGRELGRRSLGRLPRDHGCAVEVGQLLNGHAPWGHLELTYDFTQGKDADGWLHALIRYEDRETGHAADTSFGSHVFNTVLTFKGEPQSYAGSPPGLSTRLFLRLAPDIAEGKADSFCHLIYPASTPWHPESSTELRLIDSGGQMAAQRGVRIPCGGSLHLRASEVFGREALAAAGPHAYILVRDQTCRLFGYHGLVVDGRSFSLDHMFGF